MSNLRSITLPPRGIRMTALSPGEWQVSDATVAPDDPAARLGYIARIGDHFEVTDLDGPLVRFHLFASLETAMDSFASRVRHGLSAA